MNVSEFQTMADMLPEAMLLVSGQGTVVAANRGVRRRLGLDPDHLSGKLLTDYLADDSGELLPYLRACSRTRDMIPGIVRISTEQGGRIDCRVEGTVFRPRSGSADALILLRLTRKENSVSQFVALNFRIDEQAREIKRRKRVEDELREQREWLRVTLSSIGDAVIATDTNGEVTFMNPIAEGLTGWPLDDAGGKPLELVFQIINEETRERVANPVDRVLREGVIVGLANHTILIDRDGHERSIDDTAAPIRDGEGELKGVILVFHDIGERRALERELHERAEKLAQADRRKDEFLAMLSHELRNPLAPILNALRVLESPVREDSDIGWATEIMQRQVGHMARLVDDLLDVSRITHGKIELRKETVELAQVVAHAVEASRPLLDSRRHTLTVSLPEERITLKADPARLKQVFANVLNNAAKYTEEGGQISIGVGREGSQVVILVRDSGVGIHPDVLPSVFDLFVQADGSLDRSQGGLGIGLTLVNTLVKLHGGSVSVRSKGLGHGSEFSIHLPVAPDPSRESPASSSRGRDSNAGTRRILIVDDNLDSARSLGRLLGRMQHQVRVAHDGLQAITAAEGFKPEVVLLDIGLPGMNGYEVARHLRHEMLSEALIVAISGYGQKEDRRLSREAGFDDHLVKPVDYDALTTLIARGR